MTAPLRAKCSCSSHEVETIDLLAANNSFQNTIYPNIRVYSSVKCDTTGRAHILSVIQTLARLVSLQMGE